MHQFTLGSATITLFNAGDIRADLAEWFGLNADEWPQYRDLLVRPAAVPMNAVHIALGEASVLVDVPRHSPDIGEEYMLPGYAPPPDVPTQLRAAGIAPEAVTHVVITHTHFDHYNGLSYSPPLGGGGSAIAFPNARHYIGLADWETKLLGSDGGTKAIFDALDERHLLIRVGRDLTIADGIDILATPGETPGHQIVRVRNGGQTLYVLGDLYHHEVEFAQPDWSVTWADAHANQISRARFVAAAQAEDAQFIAGHIRGVGRFNRATNEAVWCDGG